MRTFYIESARSMQSGGMSSAGMGDVGGLVSEPAGAGAAAAATS